jgi:hypothetical protein
MPRILCLIAFSTFMPECDDAACSSAASILPCNVSEAFAAL